MMGCTNAIDIKKQKINIASASNRATSILSNRLKLERKYDDAIETRFEEFKNMEENEIFMMDQTGAIGIKESKYWFIKTGNKGILETSGKYQFDDGSVRKIDRRIERDLSSEKARPIITKEDVVVLISPKGKNKEKMRSDTPKDVLEEVKEICADSILRNLEGKKLTVSSCKEESQLISKDITSILSDVLSENSFTAFVHCVVTESQDINFSYYCRFYAYPDSDDYVRIMTEIDEFKCIVYVFLAKIR